jgi:hypothetical protein
MRAERPEDGAVHEAVKRELASRPWAYMQDHADATSVVIAEIMARAGESGPT